MKILIVKYLPSGERSNTKKLLDCFLAEVKTKDITTLNLLDDLPDYFTEERLTAYVQRNYMGQALSESQKKIIEKMDRMTAQFKLADLVVLAFPMHNFSLPAAVKGYFDSILLKGETWDITSKGFQGLMTGKKALILTSSGGVYEGPMASWEHAQSLAKVEFGLMGIQDVRVVTAAGLNRTPEKLDQIIGAAKDQVKAVVKEWAL